MPIRPENELPIGNDVLNHANFGLLPEEKGRFGSFGVSLVVNGLIGLAIIALTLSTVHEAKVRQQKLELTYLAAPKPYVPPVPKVKLPPIPVPKVQTPKIVIPKPVVVPEPPKVEPIKIATKAPEIPVPAPRPVVQPPAPVLGAFHSASPAPVAAPKVAAVTKAAGFGEPVGVAPSTNSNRAANIAAVGAFGSAASASAGTAPRQGTVQGTGFGSGLGTGSPNGSSHGVVSAGAFGTGTQPGGTPGAHGTVASGGFGTAVAAPTQAAARVQQPATTAIVVLSKPSPRYTEEAREMRVQGDVTLEVRFTAAGSVEVLRVVNGLGHGLDEQARVAAQQIRFKPATRDGKAVDQVSLIHIAFQLA